MVMHSGEYQPNPAVRPATALERTQTSNREFFERALGAQSESEAQVMIGLVGHRDIPGVTLRRAQEIMRWDMRPSAWSHAFMILEPGGDKVLDVPVREVTLHPHTGAFPDPASNAVTDATLGSYADEVVYANLAVLAVGVKEGQRDKVLERAMTKLNEDRLRYDLWQTLGVWQAYLWSGGAVPNPLREGVPEPSTAFVQYCFEAIGIDLAPGASERNSAPEHLWNAARWWHVVLESFGHKISGYDLVRDPGCSVLRPDELPERVRAQA